MSDVSGQRQQCGIQWLEGNSTETHSTRLIAAKHFTESQTDVQTFKKNERPNIHRVVHLERLCC